MNGLHCCECKSERKVEWYAFNRKSDGLMTIGVLCEDCWVIVYESGTYVDEEGNTILQEAENR